MKSQEYFKFVVSKIESDLKIYSQSGDLLKCLYVMNILKESDNLLKDIYLISRIKNLKSLGNYLLFILKKTETGEVRFDNLLENLILDKDFILTELLKRFNIDKSSEPPPVEKKPKLEEPPEDEIATEIKRILAQSHFKVEEIDNELVTEEFIESNVKDDNDLIVRGNYLELIQPHIGFEEESVFSLPSNKQKSGIEEIEDDFTNDVFSLPGEKITDEQTPEEDAVKEKVNTDEIEEIKLNEPAAKEEPVETEEPIEEINEIKDDTIFEEAEVSEEEHIEELIPEEEEIEIPAEKIPEEIEEEKIVNIIQPEEKAKEEVEEDEEGKTQDIKQEIEQPSEEHKEEVIEEVIEQPKEEKEIIPPEEKKEAPGEIGKEEKTVEETIEEEQLVEVENSVYMQYETELFSRNERMVAYFEELKGLNPERLDFEETRNSILKEIIDNSFYMEEYSRKMSFEVITGIYNVIFMTFSLYGNTVGIEILALFKSSIKLIEGLIKGEDIDGFDNIMKSLETLKNTLIDSGREAERTETQVSEREMPDEFLITKHYDTSERQKLTQLKQNILSVENIFKSLEDIKGKFQAYEALRRLSHTFAYLKELVSIANALELRKISQLAEASYIFIKFIQNYRMNPFESEISEVFKYIIYNFKLIFLDKPTKDIDLFISYLNDPVKIFEKKE